jgi:hypothetical protein
MAGPNVRCIDVAGRVFDARLEKRVVPLAAFAAQATVTGFPRFPGFAGFPGFRGFPGFSGFHGDRVHAGQRQIHRHAE